MRALLDLVLPVRCVGCGARGALACAACVEPLQADARVRFPRPSPPELPPPYAVVDYAGPARRLILAYKERGVTAVRRPLAGALATSVRAAFATATTPGARVVVVPVPSSPVARRARGFDLVPSMLGRDLPVVAALEHARGVADSAGLTARQRADNLRGALRVCPDAVERIAGRVVVVADDVLTTGATLAEAARALRCAGADVRAVATIAATVRRGSSGPPGVCTTGGSAATVRA